MFVISGPCQLRLKADTFHLGSHAIAQSRDIFQCRNYSSNSFMTYALNNMMQFDAYGSLKP